MERSELFKSEDPETDSEAEELRMIQLGLADEPAGPLPKKRCCGRCTGGIIQSCRGEGFLLRNEDAPLQLEMYLVCSVASILLIRVGLYATGYPQLGGDGIHIAHMLWGGLMMFLSQMLTIAFLGRHVKRLSAILGGIGFGTFIDELGKFITSDNDYFFKPTPFILYIGFCTLFVILKFTEPMFNSDRLTPKESLANVFSLLSVYDSVGLSKDSSLLLIELLEGSDQGNALVHALREYISVQNESTLRSRASTEHYYIRIKSSISQGYANLWKHRYSLYFINMFFIVQIITQIVDIAFLLLNGKYYTDANHNPELVAATNSTGGAFWSHFMASPTMKFLRGVASGKLSDTLLTEETDHVTKLHILQLIGVCIGAICVICGVYYLSFSLRCRRNVGSPRNRYSDNKKRKAFIWFRRAMIVRLLITDSLAMYHSQFRAAGEVIFTLAILIALSAIITQEKTNDRMRRLSISGSIGMMEIESLNALR